MNAAPIFQVSMAQQVDLLFETDSPWVLIITGCAVVTLTGAFLFTDGRYFLQAEKQLDQCVLLHFELHHR